MSVPNLNFTWQLSLVPTFCSNGLPVSGRPTQLSLKHNHQTTRSIYNKGLCCLVYYINMKPVH